MNAKSIGVLLIVFLLLFCVFSCSEDDYYVKKNPNSLIVKSGFFQGNELINETDNYELQQILSGITLKKSTVLDSVLNLLDNNRIFFAQDTLGLKHYTFRIKEYISADSLRFKNLYVVSDPNNIISSVKINHFFNDQRTFESFEVQGTVFENIIGMQMKSNYLDGLIEELADGCYRVVPLNIAGCRECYRTERIPCPSKAVSFISSDDGGTNGGGGGNHSGGSANNSSWEDVGIGGGSNGSSGSKNWGALTAPVNQTHDPCGKLDIDSQSTSFKSKMDSLHMNISGTKEKGFSLLNGKYEDINRDNPSVSVILDGDGAHGPDLNYHPTQKGMAHNHLLNSTHIGTFAPDDIVRFSELAQLNVRFNSKVKKDELVQYLVCEEGNYALKIEDIDRLRLFKILYEGNQTFHDEVNIFYNDNKIKHGESKTIQNMGFLKFLEEYDLGIELYEADDAYSNWKKLELNKGGTDIKEIPC